MAKFKFSLNPFDELGINVPRATKKQALDEAKDYIRDAMLGYIGKGKSPVDGGKWRKPLTKDYALIKGAESSAVFANLELTGELLDSLEFKVKGNQIIIEVPKDQEGKAEGHLTGQYGSGKMKRKDYAREFMPVDGEKLNESIMRGVKKILDGYNDA